MSYFTTSRLPSPVSSQGWLGSWPWSSAAIVRLDTADRVASIPSLRGPCCRQRNRSGPI